MTRTPDHDNDVLAITDLDRSPREDPELDVVMAYLEMTRVDDPGDAFMQALRANVMTQLEAPAPTPVITTPDRSPPGIWQRLLDLLTPRPMLWSGLATAAALLLVVAIWPHDPLRVLNNGGDAAPMLDDEIMTAAMDDAALDLDLITTLTLMTPDADIDALVDPAFALAATPPDSLWSAQELETVVAALDTTSLNAETGDELWLESAPYDTLDTLDADTLRALDRALAEEGVLP